MDTKESPLEQEVHILLMKLQNHHLNKKRKMASYVSYVLVSNEKKGNKHCADRHATDTHLSADTHTHSLTHIYSFKHKHTHIHKNINLNI